MTLRAFKIKSQKNTILQIIILFALITSFISCMSKRKAPETKSEFMISVERYRERIRQDQKSLELHRKMIKYAKKTEQMEVPFHVYQESYEEHPDNHIVLYVLGYTYLVDGKKESLKLAEEYFLKAIDKNPEMADAYAGLGECYLKQGKIQEAGKEIKRSIRLEPKLVPGYVSLGEYYRKKGKYDKAIESYNFALKFNPESFEAYLGLGISYFHTNDYDKAIDKLNLALTLNKDLSQAHRFLGKAYAMNRKPEMALKEYELIAKDSSYWYELANLFLDADNNQYVLKALQKALPSESTSLSNVKFSELSDILESILTKRPNDTELEYFLSKLYLKMDNRESAKKHLEEIKKVEPQNKNVRTELGKIYESENQPEKAAEEYQEAAKLGSGDTSVLQKVANKFFEDKDIDRFIKTAEKSLAVNPQNADMHYKLSIAYELKHKQLKEENAEPEKIVEMYELAVQHCKEAVKYETANPDYHLRLADLYAKEGKLKALREYKEVIELAPKSALAYYHRARFMANFKFGGGFLLWGPEDILDDLKKAISLNPKLAGAYSTLGKIYDRMGEIDKATEAYQTAVRLDPSIVEAQLYLAEKYAEKAPQKAIKAFETAIDSGVNDAEVLKDYAFLILKYDEKQEWKKAQMALEKALKQLPNDPEVLMNYGYTLYLEKKYSKAIEYYKKALKFRPNDLRTLYNLAVAYEHARQHKEALDTWKKILGMSPHSRYGDTASKRINILKKSVETEEENN